MKEVAHFFDTYAVSFNAIYGQKNNPLINLANNILRKSMKLRFIKTIGGCNPVQGKKIIDIGCGTGLYAVALAKKGAKYIYGIDFAPKMIELAKRNSKDSNVDAICKFEQADFLNNTIIDTFDYSIIMGFMDYVPEPKVVIRKVISLTKSKAFFSFPASGGILAWQRRMRYLNRCDLFFYNKEQIMNIFKDFNFKKMTIEKIHRDFFVTVYLQ